MSNSKPAHTEVDDKTRECSLCGAEDIYLATHLPECPGASAAVEEVSGDD